MQKTTIIILQHSIDNCLEGVGVLQIDDDEDDLETFSTSVRLSDPAIEHSGGALRALLLLFRYSWFAPFQTYYFLT
jgi:hypothetical protein